MIKVVWPQPQTHALDSMRGDILGNRHGINFHIDVEFLVHETHKIDACFSAILFSILFWSIFGHQKNDANLLFFWLFGKWCF